MTQIPDDLILEPLRRFAVPMVLIRTETTENEYHEVGEADTVRIDIMAATAPMTGVERTIRRVPQESGVRLEGDRWFWVEQAVSPVYQMSPGDVIEYEGERYRVGDTEPWGPFTTIIGERIETQPDPTVPQ